MSLATDIDVVTSEHVVTTIKEKIKRGNLVPGQRLVEADIMTETGASRGRVRSAFQRLVAEGLVIIEEYRGASVKRLSRDEVRHIYSTREVLEGLAVRTVTQEADPASLAQVQQLQEQMNDCESTGNNREFAKCNEDWHSLLIAGSNNHYIQEFLERLRIPTFRFQFQMFYEDQVIKAANRDHRAITQAVLAGEAEKAEQLMREHIRSAFDSLNSRGDEFFA